ncbi:MAG: energy transducer TonB [Odoribacter splanchnicus]
MKKLTVLFGLLLLVSLSYAQELVPIFKAPAERLDTVVIENDTVVYDTSAYSGVSSAPFLKNPPKLAKAGDPFKWFRKNFVYPEKLKGKSIQGKVMVSFCIEKDGSTTDVKITKALHPLLDRGVVRTVKLFPKWIPVVERVFGGERAIRYVGEYSFKFKDDKLY